MEEDWVSVSDASCANEPKYIMVFCDGTGKDGDNPGQKGDPTNVYRIFKYADALPDRLEVEGETFGRITYYIPGVGSRLKNPVAGVLAKLHGMTTVRMVIDAYLYIAQHYQPNDRICLFGYSRGAFAARKVASLIFHCGLSATDEELLAHWTQQENPVCWHEGPIPSERIPIKYLCVWDTVSAVRNLPRLAPIKELFGIREEELPETVENALHVVAFHENRRLFRVTLFDNESSPLTNLQEVWFPGCHSDVGGGSEEVTDLPRISLDWVLSRIDIFGNSSITPVNLVNYSPRRSLKPHNAYRRNRLLDIEEDRIKSCCLNKHSRIHQAVQYLESMESQTGPLISLRKLADATGWDAAGYIVYCPKLQRLVNKSIPTVGTSLRYSYLLGSAGIPPVLRQPERSSTIQTASTGRSAPARKNSGWSTMFLVEVV